MPRGHGAVLVLALLLATHFVDAREASAQATGMGQDTMRLEGFAKQVDDLRNRLKIPGLSAVIVKNQKVLWAKGYGFADLENRIPATPNTLYSIASITKTFGATLIMQLAEQGKLDLEEPMSHYSSDFKDDVVRIKHLLSHTSSGTPGERFQYDGARYDYLTAVIEKKTGKPFVRAVVETFFDPLGMSSSVPYHNVVVDSAKWTASLGKKRLDRYRENLSSLAQPYAYYGAGETVHDSYPPKGVGAAAGLLSTALDLAKYDIAIDRHLILSKEAQEKAWTPFVSNSGERFPYGLGWFVMDYHGHKMVWHSGQWGSGFSGMYVKIPDQNVSIILLTNSEALASFGFVDATENPFVCSFLGLCGYAYDCAPKAEAALRTWIEGRRATGRVAIHVDPATLETYVGEYQFETLNNRIYVITREGDKLFFREAGGSAKNEVYAASPTTFFLKTRPYEFVFTTAAGQPPQLKIVSGKSTYFSKRIK